MIRQEVFRTSAGVELVKTWNDDGTMLRNEATGELYVAAIDPAFKNRTYIETDIPIPKWDEESQEPEGGWDTPPEEWPDPEEGGEDLEELGVPEELIEEEVEDDAEPEDPDGPLPIPEELVR